MWLTLVAIACARESTTGNAALDFGALDSAMRWIEEAAGPYPPHFSTLHPEPVVRFRLDSLIGVLASHIALEPTRPDLEWRLGNLYRMAHNLDVPLAWDNARAHLVRALALDSTSTMAHLYLGGLYVATDTIYYTAADSHFHDVLESPIDSLALSFDAPYFAELGLMLTALHRKDVPQLLAAGRRALVHHPENTELERTLDELESDPMRTKLNTMIIPGPE